MNLDSKIPPTNDISNNIKYGTTPSTIIQVNLAPSEIVESEQDNPVLVSVIKSGRKLINREPMMNMITENRIDNITV